MGRYIVEVKAESTMLVGVVADSKLEALAKARDFDYIPLTYWESVGSLRAIKATEKDWIEGEE